MTFHGSLVTVNVCTYSILLLHCPCQWVACMLLYTKPIIHMYAVFTIEVCHKLAVCMLNYYVTLSLYELNWLCITEIFQKDGSTILIPRIAGKLCQKVLHFINSNYSLCLAMAYKSDLCCSYSTLIYLFTLQAPQLFSYPTVSHILIRCTTIIIISVTMNIIISVVWELKYTVCIVLVPMKGEKILLTFSCKIYLLSQWVANSIFVLCLKASHY